MSTDSFNRSLTTNQKMIYFSGAWLLACFVLFDAVIKFIDTLASLKVITLPEGFNFLSLTFNQGFVAGLVKVVTLLIASIGFGIIYTYLARRVNASDRVSLSTACALGIVIVIPIIVLFIASFFWGEVYTPSAIFSLLTEAIVNNVDVAWGFATQMLIVVAGSLLGLWLGGKMTVELPEERGRLLGVKWYHYVWLAPAIGIYIQALLLLVYLTIRAVIEFLAHINLLEVATNTENNSLQGLFWTIAIFYGIGYLIVLLGILQAKVLSKNSKYNVWQKIGTDLLFALIVPILILMFTVVGDYA